MVADADAKIETKQPANKLESQRSIDFPILFQLKILWCLAITRNIQATHYCFSKTLAIANYFTFFFQMDG